MVNFNYAQFWQFECFVTLRLVCLIFHVLLLKVARNIPSFNTDLLSTNNFFDYQRLQPKKDKCRYFLNRSGFLSYVNAKKRKKKKNITTDFLKSKTGS